jgi:small-conductance mechanosensitive channel
LTQAERKPVIFDYFAGGLLTSCLVWFWLQLIAYFPELPIETLGLFYIAASAASTHLVCKRTTRGQLGVGIKTALFSWVMTMLILLSFGLELNTDFMIQLIIGYLFGSMVAAYLALRSRLRKSVQKPESKPEISPEGKPEDKTGFEPDAKQGAEAKNT